MPDSTTDVGTLVANEEERKKIINRLRRLEGQIRGLQSMIDSGQECDAVLTQIMAAKSALNQVSLHIIGHAMKRCLVDNDPSMSRDEVIDQAIDVFLKYSSCVK
jgi:CsoR family transcriptional regulator, copper-sensing transcriptional repressor